MADKSLTVKKGEGKALWMLGSLYDVKATSDATGGVMSVLEITIPAGAASAPPPHRHNGSEAAYVIEGALRYHIEDRTVDAPAGSFLFFPKGTLEWMEAVGAPARVLVIYTPGGMDKFFQEVAEPAKSRTLPPPPKSPPDFAKLQAAGKRHGLELLPPPHR